MLEARHGSRPGNPAAVPADATAAVAGAPAATHDHDHCLALLARRASAPPAPTAVAAAVFADRLPAAPLWARAVAPRGPPLYRLAPKSSPPPAEV
jgi:hypothetical protein